jgi:hypothetical protein
LFSISKLIVANSLPVEVDAITSYGKSTSNSAKSVPGIVNNLAISLLLCWNLTSSKALHEVRDDIWINHYSLQLGLVTFGWLWGASALCFPASCGEMHLPSLWLTN